MRLVLEIDVTATIFTVRMKTLLVLGYPSYNCDQTVRLPIKQLWSDCAATHRTTVIRLCGCTGSFESSRGARDYVGFVIVWLHRSISGRSMTKPTKWPERPAKTQISLDISTVWSVFAVRMKKPWILSYRLRAQRRRWSDWADVRLGGCPGWSESSLGAQSLLVLPCCSSFQVAKARKKSMPFNLQHKYFFARECILPLYLKKTMKRSPEWHTLYTNLLSINSALVKYGNCVLIPWS